MSVPADPVADDSCRTALVTGGASGIGRATVMQFLAAGYRVCALDIDEKGLGRIAASTATNALLTQVVDLADPESIARVVDSVVELIGVPDVLVNNAGYGIAGTAPATSPEQWDRTIAVNLSAVFHLCRLLVPRMTARGEGVIVNVSSVGGMVGLGNRAAYCASKAGVVGLTRSLAVDHAKEGLRVNAICPGTVETEWVDRIIGDAEDPAAIRAAMSARQLDGRMGTADEVAAGILFLASPQARFVNGSAFVMDGGLTAV